MFLFGQIAKFKSRETAGGTFNAEVVYFMIQNIKDLIYLRKSIEL